MRSRLVALVAGIACVVLACDTLIGLDKFKKCGVDVACASDASDAEIDDAGDASDAFVISDAVSEASSWPQWRMDNTQTEVIQGATDASLQNFQPANGLIDDLVSNKKLKWIPQLGSAVDIDHAAQFCAKNGGRLPTRIELATLLDSTRGKPPYIAKEFDAVLSPDGAPPPSPFVWSSSYNRPVEQPLHYWIADLGTGDMKQQATFSAMGVLCVQ